MNVTKTARVIPKGKSHLHVELGCNAFRMLYQLEALRCAGVALHMCSGPFFHVALWSTLGWLCCHSSYEPSFSAHKHIDLAIYGGSPFGR